MFDGPCPGTFCSGLSECHFVYGVQADTFTFNSPQFHNINGSIPVPCYYMHWMVESHTYAGQEIAKHDTQSVLKFVGSLIAGKDWPKECLGTEEVFCRRGQRIYYYSGVQGIY